MSPRTNPEVSGESGKGIRRGILDVGACVVRHFRSCLQHNRCGGNHSLFKGGELSIGHVAEPFGDRVSRKVQIQRLRWATIAAVQKRRCVDTLVELTKTKYPSATRYSAGARASNRRSVTQG